ncbi:hypothetical protein AGRO_4901 [Agrobacterium sp. ATCC 31749]|nr:hypothetical protein AGRO_4901 [Agrobacterium sp. ATCC 31749]
MSQGNIHLIGHRHHYLERPGHPVGRYGIGRGYMGGLSEASRLFDRQHIALQQLCCRERQMLAGINASYDIRDDDGPSFSCAMIWYSMFFFMMFKPPCLVASNHELKSLFQILKADTADWFR